MPRRCRLSSSTRLDSCASWPRVDRDQRNTRNPVYDGRVSFFLYPLQIDPTIFQSIPLARFFKYFFGEFLFIRREECVCLFCVINYREAELVDKWERLLVYFRPTADVDFLFIKFPPLRDSFFERRRDDDTFVLPRGITSDDDVGPLWQRVPEVADDGFKGLAAHDDGVAERELFEAFEIIGNVPEQLPLISQLPILPDRNDRANFTGPFAWANPSIP